MTRRTLISVYPLLTGLQLTAVTKHGKALIYGPDDGGYGFIFNLGDKEPIRKGHAVCEDYVICRPGVVVYQDIFSNIRQDKYPSGDLVVVLTLNGKVVSMVGKHLKVEDRVNVDVSSVEGVWRDMLVILDVRLDSRIK